MRSEYGDRWQVSSNNIEVTRFHPIAIKVMKKIGIGILNNVTNSCKEAIIFMKRNTPRIAPALT